MDDNKTPQMNASLNDSLKVGALELPNRIIMAPLTRMRAGEGRAPNEMMATYYAQRSGAGLILSEATSVSAMGVGYPNTPGIWSAEQVEGWRAITDSVHAAGGRIFLQLWHVGRISHSSYLEGEMPVAPSAIAAEGNVSVLRPETPFETPRALETDEIAGIVDDFRKGAQNAQAAGFDGVEVHGANGYLIDQFLEQKTNTRTDAYGGSVENRARLLLEITDTLIGVWGADRVGVHLSPRCDMHDMGDSDPLALFGYVAKQLGERGIAFICARESKADDSLGPQLKELFGGVYIANESFTPESAQASIASGEFDAVAFGKLYIANPDLEKRIERGAQLTEPDPDTFYGGGSEGYTDLPALEETDK